jgi:hypothetical protein
MADALSASRLPDLPHAGYRSKTARELSDAMMFLIRGLERDRLLLLEVVINGRAKWRKAFVKAYRAIKADTEFADAVFGYLVLLAGPHPDAQKARLEQLEAQRQTQTWDKRLSTVLRHSKDRHALETDIMREILKPRRVYGKH